MKTYEEVPPRIPNLGTKCRLLVTFTFLMIYLWGRGPDIRWVVDLVGPEADFYPV
jgi:hypothetical protein